MIDMMWRCVVHTASLENVDYGQKSCLALGVFIKCNSYLKKAGIQKIMRITSQKKMRQIIF